MNYADIISMEKVKIRKSLNRIGKGSSREVYETDMSQVVVKCAITNGIGKGTSQNSSEFDIYTNAKNHVDILCPVYAISEDESKLLMKKAIPISRTKDLSDEITLEIKRFKKLLKDMEAFYFRPNSPYRDYKLDGYAVSEKKLSDARIEEIKEHPIFNDLIVLIKEFLLMSGDCFRPSSWGYLDGEFVLIDYGCSLECYEKYYRGSRRVQ